MLSNRRVESTPVRLWPDSRASLSQHRWQLTRYLCLAAAISMLCLLGFCFQSGEQSLACNLSVNAVCLGSASHILCQAECQGVWAGHLSYYLVTLSYYVPAGLVTAYCDDPTVELLLSAKALLDGPLRLKSLAPSDILEYNDRKGQLDASMLACKNARTTVAWTAVHLQNLCLKLVLPMRFLCESGTSVASTLYSMETGKLVCFSPFLLQSCSN